jgi:hypothetical protein
MNKLLERSKQLVRELAGTERRLQRMSDALVATSMPQRFALPAHGAIYKILF